MTPEQRQALGLQPDQVAQGALLGLDPAVGAPAIAVFWRGVLQQARRVKLPGYLNELSDSDGQRCRVVAKLCYEAGLEELRKVPGCMFAAFNTLCFEQPQIYKREREASKGNPRNMIKLTLVAGGVAALADVPTLSPQPGEWAMATKKSTKGDPWISSRGRVATMLLKPDEKLRVESNHDSVDAACIGLYALGRFGRILGG